jgi:hypothetical protein
MAASCEKIPQYEVLLVSVYIRIDAIHSPKVAIDQLLLPPVA